MVLMLFSLKLQFDLNLGEFRDNTNMTFKVKCISKYITGLAI